MFTEEAFKAMTEAQAIDSASAAVQSAVDNHEALLALPEHYKLNDLEKYLPTRRRQRGKMTTAVIEHFASYVTGAKEAGAAVFVDKAGMKAVAVLNLGTTAAPGHADNTATLVMEQTAAYSALARLLSRSDVHGLSQREVAEFMEDWSPSIACYTSDDGMQTKHAIDAIRKITIDSARKTESTEGQFSAERSALEKVAASSAGNPLPSLIRFFCTPYHGLSSRAFDLRLSVRTGDPAKPALSLTLRMVKGEEHAEEMAIELAAKVSDALSRDLPVLVGAYSAGA